MTDVNKELSASSEEPKQFVCTFTSTHSFSRSEALKYIGAEEGEDYDDEELRAAVEEVMEEDLDAFLDLAGGIGECAFVEPAAEIEVDWP
jgi:hypothetical protein